jgi:hypothetical protein
MGTHLRKLVKPLHGHLAIRNISVDTKATISSFTSDKLKEGFVKSGDGSTINCIGPSYKDGSELADKVFKSTCSLLNWCLPQIGEIPEVRKTKWFV